MSEEQLRKSGEKPLTVLMSEPEFTYDPEIVLTAFLESRISPTGRIPSLDEVMDKNISWLKDIQTMARWYEFMRDYNLRDPLMK